MVDMWVEVEAHQMQPLAGAIAVECIVAPVLHGRERNQAVVDENVEKLKKVLEVYEARLAQSKYLAGDVLRLAAVDTLKRYFKALEYEYRVKTVALGTLKRYSILSLTLYLE
jgi:glutathione S-transferase